MSNLKVLKLDFWMAYDRDWTDRNETLSDCVGLAKFNRDGWYLQGDECWFEYKGYSYKTKNLYEDFRYKLKRLNTVPLTEKQVAEMRAMVYTLPKAHTSLINHLRNVLRDDSESKAIRNVGRMARKDFIRFEKREMK